MLLTHLAGVLTLPYPNEGCGLVAYVRSCWTVALVICLPGILEEPIATGFISKHFNEGIPCVSVCATPF